MLGPGSGAGTSSSFCPALGPDSGAPGSGPRDFKTLYLGTASSLSLSPGGEGKGGCWKGGPPRAGWESPFGCGGLPAGEGGAAEPGGSFRVGWAHRHPLWTSSLKAFSASVLLVLLSSALHALRPWPLIFPSLGPPAQILGPLSGAGCLWQLPLEGQPAVGGTGWDQGTAWQPWGPGGEGRPLGRQ